MPCARMHLETWSIRASACLLVGMGRRLAAARQQVPAGPLGGHEQGRLRVDPRGGAGDLDPAPDLGRVGEVGHPVRAHAAGVGERRGELARRAGSRAAPCWRRWRWTRPAQPGSPPRRRTPTRAETDPQARPCTGRTDTAAVAHLASTASSSSSMVCGRVRPRANRVRKDGESRRPDGGGGRHCGRACRHGSTAARSCSSSRTSPRSPRLMRDFLEADGFRVLHAPTSGRRPSRSAQRRTACCWT